MSVEAATFLTDLNPSNPPGPDPISQADDHIRLLKSVLLSTFPAMDAALTATPTILNGIDARATALESYATDRDTAFGTSPGTSLVNNANVLDRAVTVRAITGTTDTIVATDLGSIVTYANAAAIAAALPQAGSTGFPAKWFVDVFVLLDGAVTFTTSTSTINANGSTLLVRRGQWVRFISDGTNWTAIVTGTRGGVRGADIATATTLTLPTGTVGTHSLTGTTTTTGIGSAPGGTKITLVSAGVAQFTHNATSFILLGGANITTAAGDVWEFTNDAAAGASGTNWRMTGAARANGKPLVRFDTFATQADMEAATSNSVVVTPGVALYHPGSVKAFIRFVPGVSPNVLCSYGMSLGTPVTRNGTGDYTITFATAFSSANAFCPVPSVLGAARVARCINPTTTTIDIRVTDLSSAAKDDSDSITLIVTGDLP